ncbi:hypothetical protein [Mesorhizobium sp.]|nr:hypothetical protein [Mesorhizobium sp.]RWF83257.1 MAG: hypothetical protein EOQ35_06910 [Mesorhizobium sp.]RWH06690.1 MAG: hypothetical protein EOQ73_04465 [Mesorhizobium sp.]
MAVALGFVITTAVGAEVARRKNNGADTIVTAAAVGVIAGLYSAFKAMPETGAKLPDPGTIQFAFFVLIAGTMFVLPTFVRPYGEGRWVGLTRLYGRMALASLIAGVATLALQSLARFIPDAIVPEVASFYAPSHPSFFLVRPAGVGFLIAPWIILTYDPLLNADIWAARPRSERLGWTVGFWTLAAALVAAFVWFFYWPEHNGDRLGGAGVTLAGTVAIFLALMLSPLGAAGMILRTSTGHGGHGFAVGAFRRPLTWVALAVAVAGSAFVSIVLMVEVEAGIVPAAIFAAFHLVAAVITWAVGLHFGARKGG